MNDLTQRDIADYGTRLAERRAELLAMNADSDSWRDTVALDQQSVGRLSRMDALQQQSMAKAEARRRSQEIVRIDAALRRIEAGEFGWCLECGEPIARKRLDFDPSAAKCVGCSG